MSISDFNNLNHPELQKGEVYISSLFREEDYVALPYKTKRKGVCAYDFMGNLMRDCFPVFANEEEVVVIDQTRRKKS